DRADAKARDHRQHPLGPVADQRHHHVAAADPARGERAGHSRPALAHPAEAPPASRALAGELHERDPRRRQLLDDVAGEVHGGILPLPAQNHLGALNSMAVAASPYTEMTDEQKAITEMVHQFADEQILPNAEHYDHEASFPEPLVGQM